MGKDFVAVVTGAADGIGFATAQRFAASGYKVALLDLQKDRVMQKATSLGTEHLAVECDVSSEADVKRAIGAVTKRYGRIDAVVNNAGIGSPHIPTLDQGVDQFERVLRVHLTGAFLVSRESARTMILARRGCIVNISSIAGLTGLPRRNAYGAAKAGVVAMTKSMACEWAPYGIRVNAVAPGYTATELVKKLASEGSVDLDKLRSRIPLGRLADATEIADAIYFLSSSASTYITGSIISVDGGWAAFGDAGSAWNESAE